MLEHESWKLKVLRGTNYFSASTADIFTPVEHSNIPNNKANLNSNLTGRAQLQQIMYLVNPPALDNKRGLTSVFTPLVSISMVEILFEWPQRNGTFMNQTLLTH